jgi:hypothetical protein
VTRLVLGLLTAALLIPASASAATFGPAAPVLVRGESAECLRATGTPGELFTMTRDGVQLLTASRAGVAPGQVLALGTSPP